MFSRTDFSRLALRAVAYLGALHAVCQRRAADARDIGRFVIEQVMTQYTVAGGKPSNVPEIVVTGPSAEPPAAAPDLLPL